MLNFNFEIKKSGIPYAGKGLYTLEELPRAKVVIFPNQKHILHSRESLAKFPADSIESVSAIRWFEETYTVDPEWSEESHLNHSFSPNCLWHLGFVFALRDISKGEELTIDYRMLLDEETVLDFKDALTGREIRGLSWQEKMAFTSEHLLSLFRAN